MPDSKSRQQPYHPEAYWSDVAARIGKRVDGRLIAGDDEPYYRYKRQRFLDLLHSHIYKGKHVLEVGPGPGGNLLEILKHNPASLQGADISQAMINIAQKNVGHAGVSIHKTDGENLPFPDGTFDIVFTATVLQHNSDDRMFENLLREICRVSRHQVLLLEGTDPKAGGTDLYFARSVQDYERICQAMGFPLSRLQYANTRVSYFVCGAIRKLLNSSRRQEGEPLSGASIFLENLFLPVTKRLDRLFRSRKDLTLMLFEKAPGQSPAATK